MLSNFLQRFLFVLFIAFIGWKSETNAQPLQHSIYLEAGGSGGYYSLNYAMRFRIAPKWRLRLRTGTSILRVKDYEWQLNPDLKFPLGIGVEYGEHKQFIFSAGTVVSSLVQYTVLSEMKQRKYYFDYFALIGYKHRFKNRLFVYAGYNPIFSTRMNYQHWAAAGFGYTFQ